MFRRRRLPESLSGPHAAFAAVVGPLERAKAVLTEAVPTARLPGRSLPDVLAEFEELLGEVRTGMDAWRHPELEAEWQEARSAVAESLRLAEALRLEAPDPGGFEELIGAVGDLLAPLVAFQAAAERFRRLRR